MDLSGRPLLDTAPDGALFAGREAELERLVAAVERRENALVVGGRGSGKTTLLRRVAYELRARAGGAPPAFVEGRLAPDARTFVELVRYRLDLPERSRVPGAGPVDLVELVAGLRPPDAGRRTVIVDELGAEPGHTMFGRLRDDVWQLPITWIVAVGEGDAGAFLTAPADAFFDLVLRLAPLPRDAQRRLLEARAGEVGRALADELDEGNPRRLLTIARAALHEGADAASLARAQRDLDERVARLGPPAAMVMAELESLGAVSASDEDLLDRLGWTRSRAVQVLRRLEDEGLVVASTVKRGAGRPRKVYRPALGDGAGA